VSDRDRSPQFVSDRDRSPQFVSDRDRSPQFVSDRDRSQRFATAVCHPSPMIKNLKIITYFISKIKKIHEKPVWAAFSGKNPYFGQK
jgi:hypothetical protein